MAPAGDQDLVASRGAFHPVAEVVAEPVGADDCFITVGLRSGARGTRTPDLSAASRTLSQLSYSPKLVFARKINAGALAISGIPEPQMQLPLPFGHLNWNQKRFRQLATVDGDRIYFIL